MKTIKLFALVMGLAFITTFQSQAQEIGLRFGDFYGNNVAIDGIFATGDFSRIHADVSFGGNGLGIDALWLALLGLDGGGFNKSAIGRCIHHGIVCDGQQHQPLDWPLVVFAPANLGGWRLGHPVGRVGIGWCICLGFVDGLGA